jgi:N-acetylmuramoyl-L-alanine amidase
MIKSIYQHFLALSKEQYLASLKEAEKAEDFDVVEIVNVPEELPTCKFIMELRDWIQNQTVMRMPEFIAVHATGTLPTATATAIQNYWRNNLKWKNPGYHILVHTDGSFTIFADLDVVVNGVAGFNSRSWHVSYIGGLLPDKKTADTRTPEQKKAIEAILQEMRRKAPNAKIRGHRDFPKVNKACPCFNAIQEFAKI